MEEKGCNGRPHADTNLSLVRPEVPFILAHRAGSRNLEPVPVAAVVLQVVAGSPGQVDLPRAVMVKRGNWRMESVPRDAKPNLGTGKHVGCLGRGGRLERLTAAAQQCQPSIP